jgi:hypothetical protein
MLGSPHGFRVRHAGQRVGALRGPEEPRQGASAPSTLGTLGKKSLTGLRRRFQGSWGWGARVNGDSWWPSRWLRWRFSEGYYPRSTNPCQHTTDSNFESPKVYYHSCRILKVCMP